ncbi:Os09g0507350, partial [Oryza sativa Japonica Group]
LLEHHAHAHVHVGLQVAVEQPHARVARPEPHRRPPHRVQRHRVLHHGAAPRARRVQTRPVHLRHELALAVAEHPEVVPVEVPRVRLAPPVRRRDRRVLQHHVDHRAQGEAVRGVAHGEARRRGGEVEAPVVVAVRRRPLVELAAEAVLHGDEVRRRREAEGDAVDGPLGVVVDLALRVEEEENAVGPRRRRLDVPRQRGERPALRHPARRVVPPWPGRRRRARVIHGGGGVPDDGPARRRLGGVAADDVRRRPVAPGRVLVGGDEHGVGLAGVDEEVLDHHRRDVVPVGLHHRHRVPLDLEAQRRQRRQAADAEAVRLPRRGGEQRRPPALAAKRIARRATAIAGRRRRAVEHASAVDQKRLGLADEHHGDGGEADGLLVHALVPPVHEEDGVLAVVGEGLGDAVGHRHDEHAVQPRHALHAVVRVVHVRSRLKPSQKHPENQSKFAHPTIQAKN